MEGLEVVEGRGGAERDGGMYAQRVPGGIRHSGQRPSGNRGRGRSRRDGYRR